MEIILPTGRRTTRLGFGCAFPRSVDKNDAARYLDAAFDAEFRAWIAAVGKGVAAGPSAWDGYVATAATLAAVVALESGAPETIKLRERPALYAS